MASWRADPQFVYYRYCWESAHEFIRDRFDRRTLTIFEACAVPAMQSDVFRLCWLFEQGGIYVDADQGNRGRNESFTGREARGHLFRHPPRRRPRDPGSAVPVATPIQNSRAGIIQNCLMSFFDRHDPLVGASLERVCSNVERRIDDPIWRLSGPGVISGLFTELGSEHALFKDVHIHGVVELGRAMNFVRCDYKSSTTHWQNFTGPIYRSLT